MRGRRRNRIAHQSAIRRRSDRPSANGAGPADQQ
jgi:hypothetical protein